MLASIAFILAGVGAAGFILYMTNAIPAFSKLPVPAFVWPVVMVAGLVVFILFRRPSD